MLLLRAAVFGASLLLGRVVGLRDPVASVPAIRLKPQLHLVREQLRSSVGE